MFTAYSGLTVPLLLAPDGSKIGKTTSSNQDDVIYLSSKYLRPFHFFQKILSLPDTLMTSDLLKCLTFFSQEEIDQLLSDQRVSLFYFFVFRFESVRVH